MTPMPRNVIQLVTHQVQKWNIEQAQTGPRDALSLYWPIITVSREFGARGAQIGKLLAQRLDFELWDQELVHAIAQESGAHEPLLASVDERTRGAIGDFVEGAIVGSRYTNSEYLRHLMKVVHTLAHHGRAVVVGRGAQYILDPKSVFRLRAVCPLAMRVAGLVARDNVSESEARARIERIDRERAQFMRHQYGRDINEPTAYDLIVNTGTYEVDAAAELSALAYRAKFPHLPLRVRPAMYA